MLISQSLMYTVSVSTMAAGDWAFSSAGIHTNGSWIVLVGFNTRHIIGHLGDSFPTSGLAGTSNNILNKWKDVSYYMINCHKQDEALHISSMISEADNVNI